MEGTKWMPIHCQVSSHNTVFFCDKEIYQIILQRLREKSNRSGHGHGNKYRNPKLHVKYLVLHG